MTAGEMPAVGRVLEGRAAVVTGGGSGIGRATSLLLAERGARVMIGDLDEQSAHAVASEIRAAGGEADARALDVTDEHSTAGVMDAAAAAFGSLDILVANAGIAEPKMPMHEMDMTAWERVVQIDLTGVALSNKHALRHMVNQRRGAIVNMASFLGLVGQPVSGPYSAAKAGVVNLTRSIGVTYAGDGIRVNAVAPGYVRTPLLEGLPRETRSRMVAFQPIGRLAEPEEIARVIAFLASDEASFITATTVSVDGGGVAV